MTIALLPERTHGKGETESFRLINDPRQIRSVKKETRTLVRHDNIAGVLERIADYIPIIQPATVERDGRLHTIGLHRLAEAERTARRVEIISYVYPELVDESYELWNKFLPTRNKLEDFAYDSIPDEALGYIETAQAIGAFDSIQIWSPEGNDLKGRIQARADARMRARALQKSRDPMAVGIVTDQNGVQRFFSIVRWGESLLPVEQIARYVKKVDAQELRRDIGMTLFWIIAALSLVFGLVALLISSHFLAIGPISLMVGALGFGFWSLQ
jgi:hypothetical protein